MEYSESLKKNRDFQLVYKMGTSYVNKYLVMYVRKNQLDRNRIGISVSKKVGNSVVRHRLCRLVKLRIIMNFSFQEIGEILNKSEVWARVNFYRAKQKIKEGEKNEIL